MPTKTHGGNAVVTAPTDTQVLIVREFDAPRRLVYKACTTPELIKRWWAGRRGTVAHVEVDLRVGGGGGRSWSRTAASRSRSTASTGSSCRTSAS